MGSVEFAPGQPWLWAAGIVGVLLTALYTFRLIFLVFFGESRTPVTHRPGYRIAMPVIVLAALSLAGGWFRTLAAGVPGSRAAANGEVAGRLERSAFQRRSPRWRFLAGLGLAYLLFLEKARIYRRPWRNRFLAPAPCLLVCGLGLRLAV